MSGNSYLVDTNIVLYLLAGDKRLADILNDQVIFISFITELELLGFRGLTKQSDKIIKEFISECTILDINKEIKNNTLELRKKFKLKLPDAIIAATAKYINCPLITADKDFEKIEDSRIIIYETDK
jgi:predicted nucleic acid-binding protein